jgi:hypothetical protein
MSGAPRQFLRCVDSGHAAVVDQLVFARLQDVYGTGGTCWSGTWGNGTDVGILWANPVSDLFGLPEDFPELELIEEVLTEVDGELVSDWELLVAEVPVSEEEF